MAKTEIPRRRSGPGSGIRFAPRGVATGTPTRAGPVRLRQERPPPGGYLSVPGRCGEQRVRIAPYPTVRSVLKERPNPYRCPSSPVHSARPMPIHPIPSSFSGSVPPFPTRSHAKPATLRVGFSKPVPPDAKTYPWMKLAGPGRGGTPGETAPVDAGIPRF